MSSYINGSLQKCLVLQDKKKPSADTFPKNSERTKPVLKIPIARSPEATWL